MGQDLPDGGWGGSACEEGITPTAAATGMGHERCGGDYLPSEEQKFRTFEELRRSAEAYGNWATHPAGPRLPRPRPAP